jgi:hypothetical protein
VQRVFERIIDESRRLERLAQDTEEEEAGESKAARPPHKEGD